MVTNHIKHAPTARASCIHQWIVHLSYHVYIGTRHRWFLLNQRPTPTLLVNTCSTRCICIAHYSFSSRRCDGLVATKNSTFTWEYIKCEGSVSIEFQYEWIQWERIDVWNCEWMQLDLAKSKPLQLNEPTNSNETTEKFNSECAPLV